VPKQDLADPSGPAKSWWWSWRESNPRPLALTQVFSGRSLQIAFLGPSALADKSLTGSAAVDVPIRPRGRV
jgi:hypothetical protein